MVVSVAWPHWRCSMGWTRLWPLSGLRMKRSRPLPIRAHAVGKERGASRSRHPDRGCRADHTMPLWRCARLAPETWNCQTLRSAGLNGRISDSFFAPPHAARPASSAARPMRRINLCAVRAGPRCGQGYLTRQACRSGSVLMLDQTVPGRARGSAARINAARWAKTVLSSYALPVADLIFKAQHTVATVKRHWQVKQ
jgi:hypothetical protein